MDPEHPLNISGQVRYKPHIISKMDALLFAVALEVALLQMRVHEGSTELILSSKAKDQSGKLQYEKLVRDRNLVKDVIRTNLVQLADTGEWGPLQEAVKLFEKSASKTMATKREHERLKTTKANIWSNLEDKKEQWENNFWKAEYEIALLRDKKQDDLLNAKTRLRYAEMWLTARTEACALEFQMQRKRAPIRSLEHENRIHQEICKANELQIQERERDIQYWQVRYAEDMKDICQRLEIQRQQLQVATAKREELQALYKLHEGEMRSWLSFKEQRAARLAREEKVRRSATLIQAWWRGVMVRRALGAFRYLKNLKKSPARSKRK